MNFKHNYLLGLLLIVILAAACEDDSVNPLETNTYVDGVFITHEGPFTDGTGTVSYYNTEGDSIENNVFSTVNNGQLLGNIVQSMYIHNDQAYFVVNNAGNIEVADAASMIYETTIGGFSQARYFLPINNDKAYVSEWGADGLTGVVKVLDLNTQTVTKSIATGNGAEQMVQVGNQVYVANSGGFGRDSLLTVIDSNSDEITANIYAGDNPNSVVVDKDNAVWVLGSGYSDWNNPDNNTDGALCKIVDNVAVSHIVVPNGANDLVIDPNGEVLYFSVNGQVLKHEINALDLDLTPFIDRSFYGLGVDANGQIWAADAKDFSSNGEVVIYNAEGQQIDSYIVGIIPSYFWFEN